MTDATEALKPTHLADAEALDRFVAAHDLALVEFYTAGGGICASMEPVLGNVARASDAAVAMVDLGDAPELVGRFDVRSVPTLLVFRRGEVAGRLADGFRGTAAVIGFVEAAQDGAG